MSFSASSQYGNGSLSGVKNETLRHTWILYYLFVILSTFIGDISILVASIKFKVFKLHNFIVTIMQHIAVCDLAVCTFAVIPRVIALMSDSRILGEQFCMIQPYITYYLGTACLLLTCSMAVGKLSILKFPIRSRYLTAEKSHQLCAVVWAVSWNVPITFLDGVNYAFFDYRTYSCEFYPNNYSSLLIATGLNLLVPIIIIVVCTGFILTHLLKARRAARRSGGVRRWQGTVTTMITAVVYTIAVLPLTFYFLTPSPETNSKSSDLTFFHGHYYKFATSIFLVNILTNFFLNGLTVASFRDFLISLMVRIRSIFFTPNIEIFPNAPR